MKTLGIYEAVQANNEGDVAKQRNSSRPALPTSASLRWRWRSRLPSGRKGGIGKCLWTVARIEQGG
jgi:hypothetical protein